MLVRGTAGPLIDPTPAGRTSRTEASSLSASAEVPLHGVRASAASRRVCYYARPAPCFSEGGPEFCRRTGALGEAPIPLLEGWPGGRGAKPGRHAPPPPARVAYGPDDARGSSTRSPSALSTKKATAANLTLLVATPASGVEPGFATRADVAERRAPAPLAGVEPGFVTRADVAERRAPTPLAGVEPGFVTRTGTAPQPW
jgi:hypothetical protein